MSEWQPIHAAPKGGGAEYVTDPDWVPPPRILVSSPQGTLVAYWDWYYAPGGRGFDPELSAWVAEGSGDLVALLIGEPTHWMPLPEPPEAT